MGSRVFISCGQHSEAEISVAKRIAALLAGRGFDPYVAKVIENVFEINSGIICELKSSDYYLLINFRRDRIRWGRYHGSLFSNQEFAIAFALGFERMIVVSQKGVEPEGMLRYIGCNTRAFEAPDECIAIIEDALDHSGWESTYSRRLWAQNLAFSKNAYLHFTNELMNGRFLSLDILNRRTEIAAMQTSGRLIEFRRRSEREWKSSRPYHCSLLKASGRSDFSHTIFPRSYAPFDILFLGEVSDASGQPVRNGQRVGVFLNSAMDFIPNPQLPFQPGEWELRYEFTAIGFPVHTVEISLKYECFDDAAAQIFRQYSDTVALD